MASASSLRRQRLNAAAFACAVTLHILFLALVAWLRPPGMMRLPLAEIPAAPYEIFLAPRSGGGGGAAGAAGSPGALLRRLDSASPAGVEAPAQGSPSASPAATSATAPPAPTPELRPSQSPSIAQPQAAPPILAPAPPPLQTPPNPNLSRPTPAPALRPAQAPAPLPEPEVPQLARSQPVEIAPAPALSRAPGAPQLRQAQGPAPLPETLPELAGPPTPIQAAPAPALTRQAATTPTLRPVSGPPTPFDGPVPTLAPRGPPMQLATPSAPGLARPGAAPTLRPSFGPGFPNIGADTGSTSAMAGAAAPGAPGPAGSSGPRTATGPAGAGSGGQARAGAGPGAGAGGRGAGPHPGCSLEVLMLLTPEERVLCRNELDALAQRQTRTGRGRIVEAVAGPWLDGIPPEKRAYFDAVVASRDAVRGGGPGGRSAGLACNLGALFGKGGGAPAEKIKIPGLPCSFLPPVGAFNEESRLSPP